MQEETSSERASREDYERKEKFMQEMDWNIALEVLNEEINTALATKKWMQKKLGYLVDVSPTHINECLKKTPDLGWTVVMRYTIALDLDLNKIRDKILQRMLQSPKVLK